MYTKIKVISYSSFNSAFSLSYLPSKLHMSFWAMFYHSVMHGFYLKGCQTSALEWRYNAGVVPKQMLGILRAKPGQTRRTQNTKVWSVCLRNLRPAEQSCSLVDPRVQIPSPAFILILFFLNFNPFATLTIVWRLGILLLRLISFALPLGANML